MANSEEIRAQIERILANCEVTFGALYMGQRKLDDWECDAWSVRFTVRDGREAYEEFEFFTGLGLREPATDAIKLRAAFEFPGLTANDKAGRTNYGRRYLARVQELRKPKAPHPADVLHSLILDSSAVGQSFESWCDELGYDSDSRKAEATYRACQQNADKLARVFDQTARDAIAEVLQEY